MSAYAVPLEGGALLRRPKPTEPEFDIERTRKERQRIETMLRSLDQRIMGNRQQARRSGERYDAEADLLRRNDLISDLRRTGTALRPVREMTTPDEVMAKRSDLQRQGLEQAQGDLSRASAGPSDDRRSQVMAATEAQAVAAARARRQPGGNVPALELLPSNLNRAAAETLVREQGEAIDSAVRRVDAFENFGYTPEQAAARAGEANAAAARRNTERADAQADLARTFAARDAEEAAAAERAAAVQQAEQARRIAGIQAEARAYESVGQPAELTAMEQAELDLLRQQVREAEIGNRASEMLLGNGGPGYAGEGSSNPSEDELRRGYRQLNEFGEQSSVDRDNLAIALRRSMTGGFSGDEAAANIASLEEAIPAIAGLPDELRAIEARNVLAAIGDLRGRSPDGTLMDFATSLVGETLSLGGHFRAPFTIGDRVEANQVMRTKAATAIEQLRQWAGVPSQQ